MLSVEQILAWDPWTVTDTRDAITQRCAALQQFAEMVNVVSALPDWQGSASDEARRALARVEASLGILVDESTSARACLNDMIDCVYAAQARFVDERGRDATAVQDATGVLDATAADGDIARRLDAIGADPEGRGLEGFRSSKTAGEPSHFYRDLDRANRLELKEERTRLRAEAAKLSAELDGNIFGGIFSDADVGLAQTQARLRALDAIDGVLARGDRQLLDLDNSVGERTVAAVAVGDLDAAQHIAVFVPGLNSSVESDIRRYDDDMSALRVETAVVLGAPESHIGGSPSTVAAITWLDYDVPQVKWPPELSELDVLNSGPAVRGAVRLDEFLAGLAAHSATDSTVTLMGHSYGSLTAAEALHGAPGSSRVDNLVAFGSPGLGVTDVRELAVPAGHVFVSESESDPVADTAIFGFDPNQVHGVVNISADSATDATGHSYDASRGHGQYLAPGSTSQHNIALITAGLGDRAITGDHRGWADRLQTPIRW